jgi:PAS domain S-box-containing protein
MPTAEYRILVIDDNPAAHADFVRILHSVIPPEKGEPAVNGRTHSPFAGPGFNVEYAPQGREGLRVVRESLTAGRPYAVVFVDMRTPGWGGVETIEQLWRADPQIQAVICAASGDYCWDDIQARLGLAENLLLLKKPFQNSEVQQIVAALTRKWQWSRQTRTHLEEMERKVEQRTAELRHSEERFATAFRAAPLAQAILNFATGQIVDVNEAFTSVTGFAREEVLAHSHPVLNHTGLITPLREPQPLRSRECELRSKSGDPCRMLVSTQPTTVTGQPHLLIMAEDITARTALERQLRQSQKMEAVGQLAAGVAHDFNNILTIIQGHLSLQLATQEFPENTRAALAETLDASERAATLTRQLLAFSRKQLFQPVPFDLNGLVESQSSMLQRLIGEHIHVDWECQEDVPHVMGDAPSLEQVVTNLVINARDAMPRGGRLRIATGLVGISAARAAQNPEAREGNFVRFSVTDTGHGMDEATRARIFEPFFTTREVGQGTGMGLATVYGIVKQHEGWIEVFSDPGQGTSFFVYLPVSGRKADQCDAQNQPAAPGSMKLNVLLVEDEPAVRSIMRQLLRHCGCHVIEAGDAREGYARWSENKDRIDLLVTDIVMPGGATGHDLARQLLEERPGLRVIYSSGYSADLFQQGSDLIPGRNFLPKPYDADSVLKLIRRVAAQNEEALSCS